MSGTNLEPDTPLDCPVSGSSGPVPAPMVKPKDIKVQVFLITISTKDPLDSDEENRFLAYFDKFFTHAYVVEERGKEGLHPHWHAMVAGAPKVGRNIKDILIGYLKRHIKSKNNPTGESLAPKAVVVTAAYDHRWYDEYLRKEAFVKVLLDKYDRDAVEKLFPTLATQTELLALKATLKRDGYSNTHLAGLSDSFGKWLAEHHPDYPELTWNSGTAMVSSFLHYRMYVLLDLPAILDERKCVQLAIAVYRVYAGDYSLTLTTRRLLAQSYETVGPDWVDGTPVPPPVGNPVGSKRLWSEMSFREGN